MNHWKRFLREGEVDTITWHRVCVGGGGGGGGVYLSLTPYILKVPRVRGKVGRQTACHLQEPNCLSTLRH